MCVYEPTADVLSSIIIVGIAEVVTDSMVLLLQGTRFYFAQEENTANRVLIARVLITPRWIFQPRQVHLGRGVITRPKIRYKFVHPYTNETFDWAHFII